MLRSEIIELEKSVRAVLNRSHGENKSAVEPNAAAQLTQVKSLCAELTKKWTHELLSNAREQVIRRYVQYHQAGIVQLSDAVSEQVPAFTIEGDADSQTLTGILVELENVLEFLRRHFYPYFDLDHQASIYHSRLLQARIAESASDLARYDRKAVDKPLIDAILRAAGETAAEGLISGISYRQAGQAQNAIRFTHQLLLFATDVTTERLVQALYQQNFNSLHFFNWYRNYLLTKAAAAGHKHEKEAILQEELKRFAGIYVSPEKALEPELPATDTYIISWLQEQLSGERSQTANERVPFQFPLNLSVPQFALFIRVFYKTGCFPIENVALITRFFTEHFTTKKQTHISQKSFGRAFYNLDQSAAAVVRDFLQKMLNYVHKTYFP